jgi:translocation and assembly module TamB
VLALALAALIVMSTGWFQRWLEHRVVAGLEHLTGGRVEIVGFRFRPWLFQLTLRNVMIHGQEGAGQPALISARNVVAHLGLEELLRQRLHLNSLDIDDFEVHLHTNAGGATNLPGPVQQSSPQESLEALMDLSIGRLTVSHSAFFWNNQRSPFEMNARELAILLRMTRGHYTGSISSTGTTIQVSRWPLPPVNFTSRFELSRTNLIFSSFAWQAEGITGEAAFNIHLAATPEASATFMASADLTALGRIFEVRELRGGTVHWDGQAQYRNGEFSARGHTHVGQVTLAPFQLFSGRMDGAADYTLEKRELNLTNLSLAIWGGAATGTLQANLDDSPPSFHLSAQLHGLRLDEALRFASPAPLLPAQSRLSAATDGVLKASWSGSLEKLQSTFDLTFSSPEGAARNQFPVSGHARGSLNDARGWSVNLTDAEIQTAHSTVTARGTLAERQAAPGATPSLDLTVATTDFEEWRPVFQSLTAAAEPIPLVLASRAEFSGQLTGTAQQPSLQGQLKMGKFQYHGWTWDRLTAVVALSPSLAQISAGRVERGKSSFVLNTTAQMDKWRMGPNSALRLSALAEHTPIEGLEAAVNAHFPARGLVTGRIEVTGTVGNLEGGGVLRIDNGAIADEPFDSLSADLHVAQSVWKLGGIQITKGHGRLSGDLTLEPARRFASGQLRGSDFLVADIQHLSLAASSALPKGHFDGRLSFEVKGSGTPDTFHMQGVWRVRGLGVAGTLLGDLNGTMAGDGQQLQFEGDDQGPAGTLHLTAHVTAAGDWPVAAQGQYSGLRIDPWIRAFFNHEFAALVTAGGAFEASGPLRVPAQLELRTQASELSVNFPTLQWKNDQPIEMHYHAGALEVSRFVMRGPSTELEIDGAVHFAERVTLALRAEGKADATLLAAIDPHLQASGRSELHLRLTGTPARPALNGTMDVQDVNLSYGDLPFRFNNLQGTIQLNGDRAVIRTLRGVSGGGTVDFAGSLTLAETARYDVLANLNQVRVRYPPSFTSVLGGSLRLVGNADRGELQGDVVVRQMFLNERGSWLAKIIESANSFGEQPTVAASPLASKIRMNVRVTSSPPIRVETQDLRLVADVDVRIQGTLADPVQLGTIHLLSGEAVFRGNRYTLVRGDLSLTNRFRTQAYFDLEAQTRVQTYSLTLDITGPVDRLKFAYRSDPPLSTTDILSLLALGYVRQEGAFAATGANPTASVGASAILSEALSSQVTGRIQRLFGVSRIKIDPNVGLPGYGSGARVTVEQQVTHDLTLTYVTITSASQYRIIQFEWAIGDNVSVLGLRDQNGIFGLEFRFRRRFK